jgi:3-methylfumaryl-CoA hydratase
MAATTPALEDWTGRQQTITDTISPVQVRQMAATLNDAARMQQPDIAPLPAGWHWLYFNPMEVQSLLGEDGHPQRGSFLPPVALPRRMWAGGRLTWHGTFHVGVSVRKSSEILSVTRKTGRTGEMVFVTVAHRYTDTQGLLLIEEHDIVYRDMPTEAERAALQAMAAQIQSGEHSFERKGEHIQAVNAEAVMLYRYSAATFNGHRIHYDVDYCRNVEGYPGLVVHGPLIATLLLGFIENQVTPDARIKSFEFRAMRPTFDLSGFHLHASKTADANVWQLWSTNNTGQIGIQASVTLQ